MTTTISTTPPDIPLPAGAVFGDAWEGDDPQRVIMGPLRGITDTYARVENGGMRSSEVAAQAGLRLIGKIPKLSGQAAAPGGACGAGLRCTGVCFGQAAGSRVTRKPMAASWAMWLRIRRSVLIRRVW